MPQLPELREDLNLLEGDRLANGDESWLVHDPLKNSFFRIDKNALQILRYWSLADPQKIIEAANKNSDDTITEENFKETLQFLISNRLTLTGLDENSDAFADQEAAASPALWKQIIHKYLFFKIPLFQPDGFLRATAPFVKIFFLKQTWLCLALLALVGFYLVSRQWDEFVQTFLHFLSFEGALFYGATLIFVTLFHELGHAYTAHHYKCRVSTIGLAFIVMFPILYTDTTDAWRLKDRRHRLHIDIAGIGAELIIASLATLAWSFIPDGAMRSAAFFLATTSWTLSLLVNLNPFMRFDGYYIFSDMIGIENLQQKSFALGRWRVRKILFGLRDPAPFEFSRRKTLLLTAFAWGTWIYRFFLFLGIALFVHAFFHKALGILLFIVEIGWFIGRPILDEVKAWFSIREQISSHRRGWFSLAGLGVLGLAMCLPWQSSVRAPAIITPVQKTEIFAHDPGKLRKIHVEEGQAVKKGDLIFSVAMPDIEIAIKQTQMMIEQTRSRLNRRVSDREDRSQTSVLRQSLITEQERLAGYEKQLQEAIILAPHDGIVTGIAGGLDVGQWVNRDLRLTTIMNPQVSELLVMTNENARALLEEGRTLKFIPDDIQISKKTGIVTKIGTVAEEHIQLPVFSSIFGGAVAVEEDDEGRHIPTKSMFALQGMVNQDEPIYRTLTGVAIIRAKREAPISAIWRRVSAVLIREVDF